ncbi:hypothetical protein [Zavarzinella formosa]|uniref:hypothetical protein n=1 Tax=Zavarzinella formosa TaxID=360055 RepID=UPI0002FDAF2D|nr:hypothetical protein [Zavarzinella formosa]
MTRYWSWGCLLVGGASVAGCHVISPEHLKSKPNEVAALPVSRAVDSPVEEEDSLGLAADAMVAGRDAEAATHLKRHLRNHPDQLVFRNQLAELLFKLDRHAEAQFHFARFDETAAASGLPLLGQRIHCHTRLMEIAQVREDAFAEKLHRGIGLHLIAGEVQSKAEDPNELSPEAEQLWCRAANELKEARTLKEDDARSAWYLHLVWSRLDQPRPAEKALRAAAANAVFAPLPAGEDREMRNALNSADHRPSALVRNTR